MSEAGSDISKEFNNALARFEMSEAEEWEICCRKMQVALIRRSSKMALSILSEFIRGMQTPIDVIDGSSHVSQVFSVRIANTLEQSGFYTLDSVDRASDEELLSKVSFLGPASLLVIRRESDLAKSAKPRARDYSFFQESTVVEDFKLNETSNTSKDPFESAINLWINSPERVIARVQSEINELEERIAALRKILKIAGKSEEKVARIKRKEKELQVEEGPLTTRQQQAESLLVNFIASLTPGELFGCKEAAAYLTEAMGENWIPVQVGRLLSVSSKLVKCSDGSIKVQS